MGNRKALPFDGRGYQGAERNRQLDPEQVIWARGASFRGEVTTRELAKQFGMSIDSVRRMLRGETYGNVGAEVPIVPATPYAGGEALDRQARESAERVAAMLGASQAPASAEGEEPISHEDAIKLFLGEEGKKGE